MTSHVGRLYALALALVVMFATWTAIATKPWVTQTAAADPRWTALVAREQRLRHESVVVRVFADAEERYRSPIVRGGEAPLAISVDVSGAQRLSLVVDHADRGDQLDRADWLDARLIK